VAESNDDMARVMGFSGFGNLKKAKQFDMSKILEDAKVQARERNATNNQALEEKAAEMAKESVKVQEVKETKTKENSDSSDSDDDFIGPPIPKDLKDSAAESDKKKDDKVCDFLILEIFHEISVQIKQIKAVRRKWWNF